jgi:tetratricopeptide (TPR) repeat protein
MMITSTNQGRGVAFCLMGAMIVLTWAGLSIAQEADSQGDAHAHPPRDDRRYDRKRDESLSRRDRFEARPVPPGYSERSWSRASGATEAYDRGYEDGYRDGLAYAQRQAALDRGTSAFDTAFAEGMDRFRNRDYGAAVRHLMLAAKLNQDDPISRLHAAHASVALGHYDDAALLLRRAFQLQPALAYVSMDISRYYASRKEFRGQLDAIERKAVERPESAPVWAVLGYFRFFSNRQTEGFHAFRRANALAPRDRFVSTMLEVARVSVPAGESHAERRSNEHKPIENR